MDLKAVVISGEAPESDDDTSNVATVCYCIFLYYEPNVINRRM